MLSLVLELGKGSTLIWIKAVKSQGFKKTLEITLFRVDQKVKIRRDPGNTVKG